MKTKSKRMPRLKSDADAERFVTAADLSEYDLAGFRPSHFEFEPKSAALNLRVSAALLDAVKRKAKAQGIPYTRYVRKLLESDVVH